MGKMSKIRFLPFLNLCLNLGVHSGHKLAPMGVMQTFPLRLWCKCKNRENQLPRWSTQDGGNSKAHKKTCESGESEKHPVAKYHSCQRSRQQQGRALIPGRKLVCVAGPQTVYQQAMRMTSWRQTNFYNIPVIPEGRDCLSFETLKSLPWLDR